MLSHDKGELAEVCFKIKPREHGDTDISRDFITRSIRRIDNNKGQAKVHLEGAWGHNSRPLAKNEVNLRDPLEGSSRSEANTLLDIESRLGDTICLVKQFEHIILNGCVLRTSREVPFEISKEGTVL